MGADTKIEWCEHTVNFWMGCEPVSEGCEHCYARRFWDRQRIKKGERRRVSDKMIQATLRKAKPGDFVFVNSLSDFFDMHIEASWGRRAATTTMIQRPDLIFLLLTKRPECMARWAKAIHEENAYAHSHIWLGITAENQARADERIPELLKIDWPGKKFVSIEPCLSEIDLTAFACSWVIIGGETGPGARPMNPEWARSVRDQCKAAGVPFFFKQWGEYAPGVDDTAPRGAGVVRIDHAGRDVSATPGLWGDGDELVQRLGKKKAGRMLDGREWKERPRMKVEGGRMKDENSHDGQSRISVALPSGRA